MALRHGLDVLVAKGQPDAPFAGLALSEAVVTHRPALIACSSVSEPRVETGTRVVLTLLPPPSAGPTAGPRPRLLPRWWAPLAGR
jgi:hypothetical protein